MVYTLIGFQKITSKEKKVFFKLYVAYEDRFVEGQKAQEIFTAEQTVLCPTLVPGMLLNISCDINGRISSIEEA